MDSFIENAFWSALFAQPGSFVAPSEAMPLRQLEAVIRLADRHAQAAPFLCELIADSLRRYVELLPKTQGASR